MAFPLDPTNGEQTSQNGIVYIYNSALGVWSVLSSTVGNLSANNLVATTSVTSDTVTAIGNITGGNIVTSATVTANTVIAVGNVGANNITIANSISTATITASGNIEASYFLGNGSQLTGIDATSIQSGNSNVRVLANSNVTVGVSGTANVAVFNTAGVSVIGNVAAGNVLTDNYLYANGAPITGGAAVGGGSDQVFFENDQTVTANYAIPSARNAMTVGPLVIDDGVVITIPDGGRWIVL